MPFIQLTVAENGGNSETMAAYQKEYAGVGLNFRMHIIQVEIDLNNNLTISKTVDDRVMETIRFPGLDIKSLIEFLQDVQQYHDEEEMVAKLKGETV